MFRMANFFISKNLDKAEKMPDYRQWKVSEMDKCVEGPILLYIRSKGWFFDRVCQPGVRYCVLTKRGFLLIYMQTDKGFVLDMRRAFEVTSLSDKVLAMKTKYRRCRIKLRFNFGTINVILTNAKIDLWRDHLLAASSSPSTMATVTKHLSLPPMDPDFLSTAAAASPSRRSESMYGPLENVEISPSVIALKSFSTEISQREKTDNNWARVRTPIRERSEASVSTALDVSTCDDDYQCLTSRLPAIDEEFSAVETSMSGLFNHNSIRESKIPVGWLRRQLEHKLDTTDKRRPLYVAPPTTPVKSSAAVVPTVILEQPLPVLVKTPELPTIPLGITVAPLPATKPKKQVKFSRKQRSPVKANARSVPNDSSSCENTRFNSFQFWRSSIFESDV